MSDATLTLTPPESVTTPRVEVNGHDPRMLISMRNIWKTYQMGTEKVHALHGVSFDIPRGEYIAIIGPSGSGKSTLMNLIGCLDTPSQGEYWLNGKNVSEMDDDELARIRNQEVGFVFQTFNLLARATALHNVELPLIYGGVGAAQRHEMAKKALQAVDLAEPWQGLVHLHQLVLVFAERAVGGIALDLVEIGARVMADARDQLDRVGQLDQVIGRADGEGLALDRRVLLARQHHYRDVAQDRAVAVQRYQAHAVDAGHDQVLHDHRRV